MPSIHAGAHYSQCEHCKRPIHIAAVCPLCGRCCCRWDCYMRHVAGHRTSGAGRSEAPRRPARDTRAAS